MGCGSSSSTVSTTGQPVLIFPSERLVHADVTTIRQEARIKLVKSIQLRSKCSVLLPLKSLYPTQDLDTSQKDITKIQFSLPSLTTQFSSNNSTAPQSPAISDTSPTLQSSNSDTFEISSYQVADLYKVFATTTEVSVCHSPNKSKTTSCNGNCKREGKLGYESCKCNLSLYCFDKAAEKIFLTQRLE